MFLLLPVCGLGITTFGMAAPEEEGAKIYSEARKYEQGEGCLIDEKKAKALYLKAADFGDPKARAMKAFWTYFGMRGFVKNEHQALDEFRELEKSLAQLKASGDREAAVCLAFGVLLFREGGSDGVAPLRELALQGEPMACLALGWVYAQGKGTEQNLQESFAWAKKAAEAGNADGMYRVGKKLAQGVGIKKDEEAGLRWIQKAAEKGFPGAQNELGDRYCHGKGVSEDAFQSSEWLRRAAEQEFPEAEFHLARHYHDGRGVYPDQQEAQKWIQLAIAHGQKNTDDLKADIQASLDRESEEEDTPRGEFTGGTWKLAGPFDVPSGSAKEFFEAFSWKDFPSPMDEGKQITVYAMTREVKKANATPRGMCFDKIFGPRTNCFALARMEVEAGAGGRRVISLGSDDAVKVWLNGREIHRDWICRSVYPEQDLLLADFQPGKNDLAVLVQNFGGPWGMAVEVPDDKSLNRILRKSVIQGDVERVKLLLESGANPNGECIKYCFNHMEASRFMGRERLRKLLAEKGGRERWYHPAWHPKLASLIVPLLCRWNERSRPGVSFLVTQRGKTLLEGATGMANIETASRITPDTRFPIGSITKHFVAASLLRLQEEGKLKLTNSLHAYFPNFPRGDKIRLRQLLDHTSGIYNYTARNDFPQRSGTPASGRDVLRYISEWPLGDFPGRRFEYSNSNYYLAGLVVEKITGSPLGNYLREKFFTPLGMRSTSLGEGNDVIPQMASAYRGNDKRIQRSGTWNMNWAGGAGGIVSTTRDMNLWMEALYGGKVLQPESLREMLKVVPNDYSSFAPPVEGYACGILVSRHQGRLYYSHMGYLPPYRASMLRVEQLGVNVIILSNGDDGFEGLNTDWLQAGMLALFFRDWQGPSARDHESVDYDDSQLEQMIGTYDDGMNLWRLKNYGHRWMLQGAGVGGFLRSIGKDEWVSIEGGHMVKLIRKASGEVAGLQIDFGSSITHAMKKPPWDPEGVEQMRLLPDYPGKYDFGRSLGMLQLSVEKGKLVGEWSNGSKVTFESVGRDEFSAPSKRLRLQFERDPGGRVARLINRNDGYTWELTRKAPAEVSDKIPVPDVIR